MNVRRLNFSRTLFLAFGGVLVLCSASGTAAVFIGADRLLGPSFSGPNGLKCTTVQTARIKRDGTYWVRKYVTADNRADGMARVRTALRVARSVQAHEKADLVQVAVLDPAGPKDRALMRGRMIGAQVVYIPDLSKVPEGAASQVYTAYYLDGPASDTGEYYGIRFDLPLEDVQPMVAAFTDDTGCVDPNAPVVTAEGQGSSATAHGEPVPGHDG